MSRGWGWRAAHKGRKSNSVASKAGVSEPGAGGGARPSQILTDSITLCKPGGQIMPTTTMLTPQIFRLSYGPTKQFSGVYEAAVL